MRIAMIVIGSAVLFGCRRSPSTTDAAVTPAVVFDSNRGEASVATRAADAAVDRPTTRGEPVDLIATLGLTVAVSSRVENAGDRPEHLIDHDPSTAWNSATDDLVGAWIDVRVPSGATVTGLEMIAGYARTNRGRDLFVMNHRVRRIEVLCDGQSLGTFALDPDSRAPQRVAFNGGPGVYRVRLAEFVAGTRRDWREACVSEFALLGHPADVRADASAPSPTVVVGSLPAESSASAASADATAAGATSQVSTSGPYRSVAEFCRGLMASRDRSACREADPEGGDACFCGLGSDAIESVPSGLTEPTRLAAGVLAATIVPVFTEPTEGVQCALLWRGPNGWSAIRGLSHCMREPNMVGDLRRMLVRRFEFAPSAEGVTLTLRWDEIGSSMQEGEESGPICGQTDELSCTITERNPPACARRTITPHSCSRRWRDALTD